VTGLVLPVAKRANSFATQTQGIIFSMYAGDTSRPGSPNRCGSTAVNPSRATRRPNAATRGVIPGSSLMTITPGPVPVR
jgi:hypothetical protein